MYDLVKIPSANFGSRDGQNPISIIVHAMGTTLDRIIDVLTKQGVSSHYLVPQVTMLEFSKLYPELIAGLMIRHPDKVPVIEFVSEENSAFHAGVSSWKDWNSLPGCQYGLNNCSIGIEFHAPNYALGDDSDLFHFTPYTEMQIQTGAALMKDICHRWDIKQENILAHSDISFLRSNDMLFRRPNSMYKTDPGPLFPWRLLYMQHQLGFYPSHNNKPGPEDNNDIEYLQRRLREIGYNCPQTGELDIETQYCINAYHMHFMHETWSCFNGSISRNLLQNLYRHYEQTGR